MYKIDIHNKHKQPVEVEVTLAAREEVNLVLPITSVKSSVFGEQQKTLLLVEQREAFGKEKDNEIDKVQVDFKWEHKSQTSAGFVSSRRAAMIYPEVAEVKKEVKFEEKNDFGLECKVCTYVNLNKFDKCEVCDSALF